MPPQAQKPIDVFTLPFVPFEERNTLPDCAAVYFVLEAKRVLYVGKTTRLRSRWKGHQLLSMLYEHRSVHIAWAALEDSISRWQVENEACKVFRPRYNKALVPHLAAPKSVCVLFPKHIHDILSALAEKEGVCMAQHVRTLVLDALKQRGVLILEP